MNRWSLVLMFVLVPGCGDSGGHPDANHGGDAGLADAPLAPDGPPGGICGGETGIGCASNQYCEYAENGCGGADETGICTARPGGCPDPIFEPTCGCDGIIYGSACDAYLAGTDLNKYGSCPVQAEDFACGYTQCHRLTQYCQHTVSDVGGEPDDYACMPIPACASQFPNCACLTNEACGHSCTGDYAMGLTLTCPGG